MRERLRPRAAAAWVAEIIFMVGGRRGFQRVLGWSLCGFGAKAWTFRQATDYFTDQRAVATASPGTRIVHAVAAA
jgi:hypothetical protein